MINFKLACLNERNGLGVASGDRQRRRRCPASLWGSATNQVYPLSVVPPDVFNDLKASWAVPRPMPSLAEYSDANPPLIPIESVH